MAVMTTGTYVIYDTTAPTNTWDPATHTEGVDYIKFSGSPKRGWSVNFVDGIMAMTGGWHNAITLGDFDEQFTIDDVVTETQQRLIEQAVKTWSQSTHAPYLYVIIVIADGNPPTLHSFNKRSITSYYYLPIRLAGITSNWEEGKQLYQTRLVVKACWPGSLA